MIVVGSPGNQTTHGFDMGEHSLWLTKGTHGIVALMVVFLDDMNGSKGFGGGPARVDEALNDIAGQDLLQIGREDKAALVK